MWKRMAVKDCIESVMTTEKIQRKDFLDEGLFPIISQEAEFINGYWNDDSALQKLDRPVVIFGDHTQVLKFVDFDFVRGADGVKVLSPRSFLHPRFFYYALMANPVRNLGYARHYRLLAKTEIQFPQDFDQQRRIVAILDDAFEGIAKATANAERNLVKARELLAAIRRKSFTSLQDTWPLSSLGEVCTFENGDRGANYPGKQHRVAEGVPFINAGHLTETGIDFSDMDYISPDRFALLGNGKIKPNDVLFCLRGSLGKFACVDDLDTGAIASSLVIMRVTEKITLGYLLEYLAGPICAAMIAKHKGGAAQPNLGAKDLKKFTIPLPPQDVQQSIALELSSLAAQTRELESAYRSKLALCTELRQSLLHNAFSGQLTRKEAVAA